MKSYIIRKNILQKKNKEIEDDNKKENDIINKEYKTEEEEENEVEEEEENKDGENEENKWGEGFENLLNEFKINFKKNNSNEFKFVGLSKKAKIFSKTIEDYRYDELKELRKNEQKYDKGIYNGNESIFLEQYNKFGKTLDFSYIYGNKNEKVFIGFKIKSCFENSKSNENIFDKLYIKRTCRKILINSMKLFNCKITKWNYFLIFYYNPKNIKENVSKNILNKCKLKDISYLFYDPVKKEFYIKEENKMININELKIDNISNLENNVADIDEFSYELPAKRKLEIGNKIMEMKQSFINDLSKTLKINEENPSIIIILSKIASIIGIGDYLLSFYVKCEFNKSMICPKKEKYVLLYKKKTDINSIGFIASIKKGKNIKYFDLSTNNEVKNLYEILDEDSKYYYCLYKYKPRKKRTYNELIKKNN